MNRRPDTPRRSVLRLALVGAAGGLLSACSADPDAPAATGSRSETSATTESGSLSTSPPDDASPSDDLEATGDDVADESDVKATGAQTIVASSVVNRLRIYSEPADRDQVGSPGQPDQVLDRADRITGQLVLLALDVGEAWTQVQLPIRPNGSTGWVRSSEVSLSSHAFSIDIDLTNHEIVVLKGDVEITRSPVGVGRTDRPTPGGEYFITELLQPPRPDGIYGPYAYGLSGYSAVLKNFRGGEGVIGIHGTNEPELVGSDVSSGCIRLPNAEIIRLVEQVGIPLGTPVTIRA